MDEPKTNLQLKAALYKKIVAITEELGKVDADGKNTHSGYTYISYENVNARLRTLLPKHQLAIVPSIVDYSERDWEGEKHITTRTVVRASFMLVDLDTGYSEERLCSGAGADTSGKSHGIAITETQKRFELKLFHISTREDYDPDSKSVEVPNPIDPIEFIRQHDDLKELAHGMKREDLITVVKQEKFNHDKVKAALESLKGF